MSPREAAQWALRNGEETRDNGQVTLSLGRLKYYSLSEGKMEVPNPCLRICSSETSIQVHKGTYKGICVTYASQKEKQPKPRSKGACKARFGQTPESCTAKKVNEVGLYVPTRKDSYFIVSEKSQL